MQIVDREGGGGPRHALHPSLVTLRGGDAESFEFDAVALAAAHKQRRIEDKQRLEYSTTAALPQLQLMPAPRSTDAPPAETGPTTSPARRPVAGAGLFANAGVTGSPLRFLVMGANAVIAKSSDFANLVKDAVSVAIQPLLRLQRFPSELQSLQQATEGPQIREADLVAEEHDVILQEPSQAMDTLAIRRHAEHVARLFADASPPVTHVVIPSDLKLGDRFLIWYGAYRHEGRLLPPLWLASGEYGNPGEVWGEC